jgi:putative ABC transport system permease protein
LNQPNNVIISAAVGRKFFGDSVAYAEMLGKVLSFRLGDAGQDFIITGIMSSVPQTSSFQFDVLIPIEHNKRYGYDNNWAGAATVYVQLAKGMDAGDLEAAFPPFVEKQFGAKVKDVPELGIAGDIKEAIKLRLQPLTEIHLDKSTESHYLVTGNITYSIVLATIALLILFIACINFCAFHRSLRGALVGSRNA